MRGKNDPRYAVAICGAYGRGNSGDEAILEAILSEVRGIDPDIPIYVLSKNPKETRVLRRVRTVHTYNAPAFFRLSRRIKLYINGGGSLIQDVTSRRSLWYYLYTIATAKKHGARVVMYGCGIGPVNYPSDRKLSARVISRYVDVITLREDNSRDELDAMGVTGPEVLLAADPALSLPPHRKSGWTARCSPPGWIRMGSMSASSCATGRVLTISCWPLPARPTISTAATVSRRSSCTRYLRVTWTRRAASRGI